MRYGFVLLLFFIARAVSANMASPEITGTTGALAFSSKDIDILHEKILIRPDHAFHTATFSIIYTIRSDSSGKQIPLLFYAEAYKDDFTVRVDGRPAGLQEIPGEYTRTAHTPFEKFSAAFDKPSYQGDHENVTIWWSQATGDVYRFNELKYFEVDLDSGVHTIQVNYTAEAWQDTYDWVTEYSFPYSLSPAEHWRSFGTLEITIDASAFEGTITTNLGPPKTNAGDKTSTWVFDKLPQKFFAVSYTPEISSFAEMLISIGPLGLTLIFAVVVGFLHALAVRSHRKRKPRTKYSWVVIAGGIVLPFFFFIAYMYSFGLIDAAIGPHAGRYHGYTFLVVLLYPFVMPVYWTIMWLVDRQVKNKLSSLPLPRD